MSGIKRASEESSSDVAAKKKVNYPSLFLAVQNKDVNQCRELLEIDKVNVNEKCFGGNTALHEASQHNSREICTLLLKFGADINMMNKLGYTPLHVCAQYNCEDTCMLLLENGADASVKNRSQNTPLHVAARHDSVDVCKILLESESNINAKGINDCTPLHLAVEYDCVEMCKELLQNKAEVNALRKGNRTPLHDAASKCSGEGLCRMLIEYGADIHAADSQGKTALHVCCAILINLPKKVSKVKKSGYRNTMRTLLTYGADPHKDDLEDMSCTAISEADREVKKCLLETKTLCLSYLWTKSHPKSKKHESVLSKVVKGQNSKRVSSYEFYKDCIGSGAFGDVYAGIHVKDGREVAVKKINMAKLPTPQHRREIKSLVQLRESKNIVNYIDFKEKENTHFVILELMEGNLEEFLSQPILEEANLTHMCYDILNALLFLHGNNIIHRDIKPNNILYASSSKGVTLKLADFGLSTRIEKETLTVLHSAAGTRCWMAPEVLRNLDYSTASDVFSCGLVLYYLLVHKKHPFAPENVSQSRANVLITEHQITENILSHILNIDGCKQPEARHLIESMLDDDKNNRPAAEELCSHPFFWSKQKKVNFLQATANQPDVYEHHSCRAPSTGNSSNFKKDLESSFGVQFLSKPWSEWSPNMVQIYNEVMVHPRRNYITTSAVELLRFIRNSYQHVSSQDSSRTESFKKLLLDDYVFLEEFKSLVIEVYKVVKKHNWDGICKEIRNIIYQVD